MLKIFDEGFNTINENFKHTFKELFGGGKAELQLDYTDCDALVRFAVLFFYALAKVFQIAVDFGQRHIEVVRLFNQLFALFYAVQPLDVGPFYERRVQQNACRARRKA